jgi:hypothetical protein
MVEGSVVHAPMGAEREVSSVAIEFDEQSADLVRSQADVEECAVRAGWPLAQHSSQGIRRGLHEPLDREIGRARIQGLWTEGDEVLTAGVYCEALAYGARGITGIAMQHSCIATR